MLLIACGVYQVLSDKANLSVYLQKIGLLAVSTALVFIILGVLSGSMRCASQ